MQQKEIRYTGITTKPSDYDCPDGDIASMMNLVNENGNLSPVAPPEVLFTLGDNQKVLYVHKTSDYCNYIVYDTSGGESSGKIRYFTKDPTEIKDITSIANKELYQINSIGNTLVILTSEGLIYALYKSGNYEILGSNPPFPSISFRLKGGISEVKSFDINFETKTRYYTEVYNTAQHPGVLEKIFLDKRITAETIYANINPDSQMVKNGGLQYDFMIRYAYKLYDGKLYMHSVPVYMNAGYGTPYFLSIYRINRDGENKSDDIGVYRFLNSLEIKMRRLHSLLYYQINNTNEITNELEKWKDLIKEISFYITPPLRYMDANFQPFSAMELGGFPGVTLGERIDSGFTMSTGLKSENGENVYFKGNYPYDFLDNTIGSRFIPLLIKNNSGDGIYNFHHIATIDVKTIKSGEQILPIESDALNNLVNRELMTGGADVSHKLVARKSFVYNACLNIANVYAVPQEYPLESCVAYTNGRILSVTHVFMETYSFKAYVFMESSDTDVLAIETSSLKLNTLGNYFFYPNVNAFKVIIERTDADGRKTYTSSKLEKHDQISGAYTDSLSDNYSEGLDVSFIENMSRGFHYPNKIYTSEVNNPFTFPATGVNIIGSGEILGIRSATKALSQGQFGQFPLYAFTDEGIWALEVSSEGKFIAKQPATRDSCNNPDSITQIDTSVLFTSERGIMLIQGSESVCISEALNEKSFDISTLKGYDQLIQMTDLTVEHFKHSNFIEYIKKCAMSYDYTNQCIIVFNKEYSYAYVFSLQSKTWGMIPSDFTNSVNSYPDSYIMTKSNTLVNLSSTGSGNSKEVKGIIITRPLKLDSPDLLKTITQSMHRGVFRKGKVKTVLYGSRDCINFVPITSSLDHTLRSVHGSPYKYFRFAIIAELYPGESISGTSIVYETRQTNKLR